MSFLDRFRAPGAVALRGAGPPEWQILIAFLGGGLIDIALSASFPLEPAWPLYLLVPGLLCLGVAPADRDGWAIPTALAYVALEQRRRFPSGLPTTLGPPTAGSPTRAMPPPGRSYGSLPW